MCDTEASQAQESQIRYETAVIEAASRIFAAYIITGAVNYPNEEAMMERSIDYSMGIIKKVKERLSKE
ncbi:MAG: hypothetical protein JW755_01160 [Candidatus Aminicenantes bacterium]|nr:hypothetical protein [Candidatus Aminicenantes bacterium]